MQALWYPGTKAGCFVRTRRYVLLSKAPINRVITRIPFTLTGEHTYTYVNSSNENQILCENIGRYMVFGSHVGSGYYLLAKNLSHSTSNYARLKKTWGAILVAVRALDGPTTQRA